MPVHKLVALPLSWVALGTALLQPLRPEVHERLVELHDRGGLTAQTDPAVALVRAEAITAQLGLAPLAAPRLPRLWVVVLLAAGAAAFWRARQRHRGRGQLLVTGVAALLAIGAVHVGTDILDLWDHLLSVGPRSPEQRGDPSWFADTKPLFGVFACLGLAGLVDRWCGSPPAAACVGASGLIVAQMWAFSISEELAGPVASLPLVAVPVAVFRGAFAVLWPELAGAGTLLFDDVVVAGSMIELLVFTNVAAGFFLLAGLILARKG